MEDSDDSDYVPEESKDSDNSSRPNRHCKSVVKNEDSSDSDSRTTNGAGKDKKKKSSPKSKEKASELVIYQCSLCPFQIDARYTLKRHFKTCSQGRRRSGGITKKRVTTGAKFRCEYCLIETGTLKSLLWHKRSHADLIVAGLSVCSQCNFTFFTAEECAEHMIDDCMGAPEKNRNNYGDARANEHITIKVEDCSDEEQATSMADLDVVKHSGFYSLPCRKGRAIVIYQCSLCSFQTNHKHKLKTHFIPCSKGTGRQDRRKRRNYVTAGAKFRCEYCSFATKTLKNLLSHKKSHADLVAAGLFECTHCNRAFFSAEQRKKHMDSKFPGCTEKDEQNRDDYDDASASDNVSIKMEYCSDEDQPPAVVEEAPTLINQEEEVAVDWDDVDRVKHNGLYFCPCKKFQTDNRSNYLRHLKLIHHVERVKPDNAGGGDEKKPLICLKCQRQADSQLQLVVHMALDHVKPGGPITCLKPFCGFETDHKDKLKRHLMGTHKLAAGIFEPLTSHSKDSDDLFRCPWTECQVSLANYKALRQHLMLMHSMDARNGTVVPLNSDGNPDGPLISCPFCYHKSRTEFQMMIHRGCYHFPRGQRRFRCPLPMCFTITKYKKHLRRHLREVHKLGEELFRNYGEEQFESDEAEDAAEQADVDVENNRQPEKDKSLSKGTNIKGKYHCGLCVFSTNHKRSFWLHQSSVHHKKQCDICKKTVWGKYQWFWHNYSVHNRQKSGEIDQWCLRCDLCGYEGTTKTSYKHGATHELSRVKFLTLFCKVASGNVTFHYTERSKIGLGNKAVKEKPRGEEDNEDSVAPSAIKVVDWTMPDEEGGVAETLQQLGTEKAITIEFADDSDAEADTQGNRGDRNIYNPSLDDDLLIKKSEFSTCEECNFETQDAALLNLHGLLVHGNFKSSQTKQYRCPEAGCPFQSKHLTSLKRHFMKTHRCVQGSFRNKAPGSRSRMKREVTQKEEIRDVRETEKKHATEVQASTNPETDLDHHQDSKRKIQKMHSPSDKKHSQEPPKWQLKCSHCPYETSLKKAAHRHGAQHYRIPIVTFHKYKNNQRRGVLKYRYPNRNLQGSTRCHNVGSRPVDSYKLNMRHHVMPNVENVEQPRSRKAKKHVGARLVRNKTVATRGNRPDLRPSDHMKVVCDSRLNNTEKNTISVRKQKEDFDDADKHSDADEEGAGLESPKNRPDINTEVKHSSTIDSDWICALEDDILNDDNEVIRIEVTGENLVEAVPKAKATTLRIKCKNKGCDYVCHDTDDIQNHAESCAKSLSRQSQSPEKCVVSTCETPLLDKETLQNHIRYEHLINREAKPKPKTKLIIKRHKTSEKIPGTVSFKCWMCSMSIANFPSLRNHTYWHARELNNFDLKVRYSKYKGDTRIGTIVIKADPAYVPREGREEPSSHWVRDIRAPSPELEYDPDLPVFACAECNFKTNKEPELTRHKKLHWSEEKAAAFNAKNLDETLFTKPRSGSRVTCATFTV